MMTRRSAFGAAQSHEGQVGLVPQEVVQSLQDGRVLSHIPKRQRLPRGTIRVSVVGDAAVALAIPYLHAAEARGARTHTLPHPSACSSAEHDRYVSSR
eukprot:scaffold1190_cov393-Prasinococcus_capsulatus_cf.AAC.46